MGERSHTGLPRLTSISKLLPSSLYRRLLRHTAWVFLKTPICVPSTPNASLSCLRIFSWLIASMVKENKVYVSSVGRSISVKFVVLYFHTRIIDCACYFTGEPLVTWCGGKDITFGCRNTKEQRAVLVGGFTNQGWRVWVKGQFVGYSVLLYDYCVKYVIMYMYICGLLQRDR